MELLQDAPQGALARIGNIHRRIWARKSKEFPLTSMPYIRLDSLQQAQNLDELL